MAHYYRDHGKGPTAVTIEVFVAGNNVKEVRRTLSNSSDTASGGQVWFAYNIVVGPGAQPEFQVVDTVTDAVTADGFVPREK